MKTSLKNSGVKKMERNIAFEKWHNPYGDDDEILKEFKNAAPDDDDDDEDEDESYEKYEDSYSKKPGSSSNITSSLKVMTTPMGIIPLTEYTDAGKIFNFWVGHTNFNLTKKIVNIIKHVRGVETLDVFTRYRFRVGIAKHPDFQPRKVMYGIVEAIKKV